MSDLVEKRRAIFDWASGDPLLLSARCAKAEESLEARSRLLLKIEGALLGYWTDMPPHVVADFTARIRETLGSYEPARESSSPVPSVPGPVREGVSEPSCASRADPGSVRPPKTSTGGGSLTSGPVREEQP